MKYGIDTQGNEAAPQWNIAEDNEFRATGRSVSAEDKAAGHYRIESTFIPDDEMNNNPDVVIRNGSREYAGGQYQPGDLIKIGDMELQYADAVAFGLIDGQGNVGGAQSPQEAFYADAENQGEPEVTDTRPEAYQLVEGQVQLAMGEQAERTIDVFSQDIIENGDMSEVGLEFAQRNLGMNDQHINHTISELAEVGGQVIHNFLETGDGLGMERVTFLVDLSKTGRTEDRKAVRKLWVEAATGRLSREKAVEVFDGIVADYG